MNDHYVARVEVTTGDRRISDFIGSAGLGITGAGITYIMVIDYKPGEVVDKARVEKAFDSMIAESDAKNTDFKIIHYRVLEVKLVGGES